MIFTNGVLGVDTFFLLSGLLVIYVTLMKREKNNEKVNWIKFYVHRFWRLTPSYMLAILFLTKLRPFFGDGPLWFRGRDTSACEDNWWTNLLYINNFVHIKHVCIPPSWYLSADMQFFIISPLLIIIAYRYGFRVLSMVGSIIIFASALTTAIILGKEDLNPVPFPGNQRPDELYDYAEYVYFKPYSRIPPYIFGIVLGYGVYKYFSQQFRMNRYIVLGAWTLAVGVALAVIYAPHNSIKEDPHVWTKGEKAIYGGLRWILWSMCVSWLIFACHYGYAGPIKDILAAKFWIPLSRINYAAFILHYDIIEVIFLNVEAPFHFTTFTLVTYYLSALVLSYSCAFIFAVVIELPCNILESVLLKKW